MLWREFDGVDRTIAKVNLVLSVLLMAGLAVTGLWQFFFHDPAFDDYVVGSALPPQQPSLGMADVHGSLADLAAVLVMWITIWLSYRVLSRIAWVALAAMAVTAAGIVTGGFIRIEALVRDGRADPSAKGYVEVLAGDYDLALTSGRELGPAAAASWTVVHVLSLPMVIAIAWWSIRRARRRRAALPRPGPSWLDRMRS